MVERERRAKEKGKEGKARKGKEGEGCVKRSKGKTVKEEGKGKRQG